MMFSLITSFFNFVVRKLFYYEEDGNDDDEGTSVDGDSIREKQKVKHVEGFITHLEDDYGMIDNEILFHIHVYSGLDLLKIGDGVKAKVCRRRTYEHWRAMTVTKHTNFWDVYNSWDSNGSKENEYDEEKEKHAIKQKKIAEMEYLEKLVKNKFGIEIIGDDFGDVEVSSKQTITLELRNQGSEAQILDGYHIVGLTQQMELGPLRIESLSLKEQSKKIQEMLPVVLEPGMVIKITVVCTTKYAGKESQMVVFEFSNFKIGKELRVNVIDRSLATESTAFNRNFKGIERVQRSRQEVKDRSSVFVPGPRLMNVRDKKYYRAKLHHYNIPEELKDCVLERRDVTQIVPCLRRDLDASIYELRFKTLLHLEEIQQELEMREFDIEQAQLELEGEFVNLKVPGLMEGRPSLIVGDRVNVSKNENQLSGRICYGGSIHRVMSDVVSLKFSIDFHLNFDSTQKYSVTFQTNRLTLRRCHRAIQQVSKFKAEVLFPSRIVEKNPQVSVDLPDQGPIHKGSSRHHRSGGREIMFHDPNLNLQQQLAVTRILRGVARPLPYVIFGPPGTGKTITVVEAIVQLMAHVPHVRILACAPSNSAADLLTERLYMTGQVTRSEMVRLCAALRSEEAIPEKVKPFCHNIEDPDLDLESKVIVVSTCCNAGSLYEGTQTKQIVLFTHVFVDEAGQATEPECMVAVAMAKASNAQVILAGDPQQLGPVLRSNLAKEHGLNISYLERLCSLLIYRRDVDKFGEVGGYDPLLVTKLMENYRCHPALIRISSCMFYDNELRIKGNPEMINCLSSWDDLPNKNNFPFLFHGVRGEDLREGNSPSWFNIHEVILTVNYLKSLLAYKKYDLCPDDIGVITPYQKQVEKLRSMAESRGLPRVKIGTVEEFQGQEKLAIIISTVRSSESLVDADLRHALGFLSNQKRFNVSITRAHSLLVIIGNPHILSQDVHWSNLIKYAVDNGAYIGCDLPTFTVDGRYFLSSGTDSTEEEEEQDRVGGAKRIDIPEAVEEERSLRVDVESEFRIADGKNNILIDGHSAVYLPSPNNEDQSINPSIDVDDDDPVTASSLPEENQLNEAREPTINGNNEVLPIPLSPSNDNTLVCLPDEAVAISFDQIDENLSSPAIESEQSNVAEASRASGMTCTDPASRDLIEKETPSDDELLMKIARQIGYYFGEVNLRKDAFLLKKISDDPDQWVDIKVLLTFNKMKEFGVGVSDVAHAVRCYLNVVESSTDGQRLRRDPSKPIEFDLEKWKVDMFQRSIVIRNYPSSEVLEKMQEFFSFCGPVVHIERNVLLRVWENARFYTMERCDLILFEDHQSARNLAKHRFTRIKKMGLQLFFLDDVVKMSLNFFVSRKFENIHRPEMASIQRSTGGFRGNRGSRGSRGHPRAYSSYKSSIHSNSNMASTSSYNPTYSNDGSRRFDDEDEEDGVVVVSNSDHIDEIWE